MHGTWTGPTYTVDWEVEAASFRAKVNQSDTVSPTYLHATLSATGSKHEPFADRTASPVSVVVRGGEGSITELHPQNYGTHWIEIIYARDQYDRVVGSSSLDASAGPATPSITMDLSAVSPPVNKLTPFEFCNLHGLWFGASYGGTSAPTSAPTEAEAAASSAVTLTAAATAAAVAVSLLAAAL